MIRRNDLMGRKFGNLEVIGYSHTDKLRMNYWTCRCKCGNYITVRGTFLRKGDVESCGCQVKEEKPLRITEGTKVRFDPLEYMDGSGSELWKGSMVTGTVAKVYDRFFLVEFGKGQKTTFHYADIGRTVKICG